jgi:hypothetical protein
MIRIFGKAIPPFEERSNLRELAEQAERRFQELPEEEQMLHLLAQKLSFVYGGVGGNREETAKMIITDSHGPKFAARVLGDPELRKKIGLDRPEAVYDPSVHATTVAVDS